MLLWGVIKNKTDMSHLVHVLVCTNDDDNLQYCIYDSYSNLSMLSIGCTDRFNAAVHSLLFQFYSENVLIWFLIAYRIFFLSRYGKKKSGWIVIPSQSHLLHLQFDIALLKSLMGKAANVAKLKKFVKINCACWVPCFFLQLWNMRS